LNFLERINQNQQKKLNREERLKVRGKSYTLSSNYYKYKKKKLLPNSVILIDDVLTTGITIEECSKLLKDAGIKIVKVLTLFIVD
jgi:predicted amidophosphoribosyltransferase